MKYLSVSMIALAFSGSAYAKDCKEQALGAAIQMEATREDANDFNKPIGAHLDVTSGEEEVWVATIVGNDGKTVGYTVKVNKLTCEVLEEPVRGR